MKQSFNKAVLFSLTILSGTFLVTGCKKQYSNVPAEELQATSNKTASAFTDLPISDVGLSPQTLWELQQVRAATAKYQDTSNAVKDGYVNIHLALQNMGYHFLKAELVDPVFDIRKPEILVYNKAADGRFELVAVEYAVPIDQQNPNTPPQGFTGDADVWDFNTLNTGWWTLHAWVWKNNPDGVFNMTNPDVIIQ